MTPWEVAISVVVTAYGVAIASLGLVVGLHLRRARRGADEP
jgi:hypothetical protein